MAVTQNFYPKFFEKVFTGQVTFTGSPTKTLSCEMALFTAPGGGFDPDHSTLADIGDAMVSNSPKTCTITMSLVGNSLEFTVPSVNWPTPLGTFAHAALYEAAGSQYLFMHFNLNSGNPITPAGQFTLSMTSGEEPQINFVPTP
jgi:hypothetical protein